MDSEAPVRLDQLPPVLTVTEVSRLMRIGRGTAYEAVRRGDIPSIRIGNRIVVPTHRLLTMLSGLPDEHGQRS